MGLAWTSMGGSSLFIEAVAKSAITEKSKPHFQYTGQMGDVMKESAMIAYTFSRSFLAKKFPDNAFFEHANIHMHVPEGATPKDGTSQGFINTIFICRSLGRRYNDNVASVLGSRQTSQAKRSHDRRDHIDRQGT